MLALRETSVRNSGEVKSNRTALVAHADWDRQVRTMWLQRELSDMIRMVKEVLKARGAGFGYKDSKSPRIQAKHTVTGALLQPVPKALELIDRLP